MTTTTRAPGATEPSFSTGAVSRAFRLLARDLRRTLRSKTERKVVARLGVIGVTIAALAGAAVGAYVLFLRADTITIRVRGVEEEVSTGTSAAEAAASFRIEPAAGDLLDVAGGVIRANAFPGRLLVNGLAVARRAELADGDSLASVEGRDRTEPSVLFRVPVPEGVAANPQFTLARTPGQQELARGEISGKISPREFHPSGPARSPKAVALTFDDGPSLYTRKILATLRRLHARATFFVVGSLAERYPGLVRRELASGMGVGSHSYSHPYRPPFDRQPQSRVEEEIVRARDVLASLGGAPTLFRPPGGSFSPSVLEEAQAEGQRVVLWSVDPRDWDDDATAKQIARRVLGAVRPGSIVLMHDGGGDQSATTRALPRIVRGIRRKGLELRLIDAAG
jgi:peptidoglycan/xylan/chitin deacetylase (PgdA/CDA1 family)